MIYYLDLDRTLFRTDRTYELWQCIEQRYGLSKHHIEVSPHFYRYIGDMYYYDFDAHIVSLGLDVEEVHQLLTGSELADGRLEHSGAGALVNALGERGEVKVLTFGAQQYQELKSSLCPSLKGIEIIATMRPKAEYFAAHPAESWLVDDRAVGDELPDNVNFVQVSLEGKPLLQDGAWPIFDSLQNTKEYICETSH